MPTPPDDSPRNAARQAAGRQGGFFAHHGFWAPGVRLFRALSFRAKALTISMVFALPIVLLAGSLHMNVAAQVDFASAEREGVRDLASFIRILHGVVEARAATRAMLGGHDASAQYASGRARVDKALAEFKQDLDRRGDPLALAPRLTTLKGAWDATAQASKGVDSQGRNVFGPVTRSAIEFLEAIGDNSKLVLDPDLDTFYLVNTAVLLLPKALEDTGQLWGWSTFAAAKGGLDAKQLESFAVWSAALQGDINSATASLKRSFAATPALEKAVDARGIAATEAFRAAAEAAVKGGQAEPAKLFADGAAAVGQLAGFYDTALPALDGRLADRITGLERGRNLLYVAIFTCVLLAAYLFASFRRVLEGGLREVAFHIDAMREGDLTTHPHPWGRDEVASLMAGLAQMQVSLRGIVSQVRAASSTLVTAAGEITEGASNLSSRTEQAASSLEQTAAATEQVSTTIRQTAEHSTQATQLAQGNADTAAEGGASFEQVVATMQAVQTSSGKVVDIIGVIDGIAFQTNILALNAAVEAARAGDAGRGFAVVASEVRALAQRSATAAGEIKKLINESTREVDNGTRVVQSASRSMQALVQNASHIRDLLREISTSAREQSDGMSQVGQSVQHLDQMTQQNAALGEQTAAAAESMRDQAVDLAERVGRFKLPD